MHPQRDDDERTNLSHGSNSPTSPVRRKGTRPSADATADASRLLITVNCSSGGSSTGGWPTAAGPRAVKRSLNTRADESVATRNV
eukprot:4583301-Prymnesium_polylepis.1